MEFSNALLALAALSQATRLQTFRLLISREPEGIPAGEIARSVGVPQNTMSAHLNVLSHAGLVRGERHSRSIIYRADLARFRDLITFLLKDCCGGNADVCAVLLNDLSQGCGAQPFPPN